MYCKVKDSLEWDDSIREIGITTFEPQNEDSRGYADTFKCTHCGCMVNTGHYMRTEQFDYNYCPYCGSPVVESEDDAE